MDLIIKILDSLSEKLNGETKKADYADAIILLPNKNIGNLVMLEESGDLIRGML